MARTIIFNKPYNVLSQFTDKGTNSSASLTLSDYIEVPGVYAAGRLDRDSEGLLILTSDGKLQNQIASPKFRTAKTYWTQVEGTPDDRAIKTLCSGIELKDGMTRPASVKQIEEPANLWPRTPPVRYRKSVPDAWLEITISEGRNRQVRRMTAAVGLPTLRLIRYSIGQWTIAGLSGGQWRDAD